MTHFDYLYLYFIVCVFFYSRYKIENLRDQNMMIIDLTFSICLEPDMCDPVIEVFSNQLLPEPICKMAMEYLAKSKKKQIFLFFFNLCVHDSV
jgi:hypothetical protein